MSAKEDKAIARLVERIGAALDDGKAVKVCVLDVRKQTVITDFMVIASGRTGRQVRALTQRVLEAARHEQVKALGVEGEREGEWVLLDFGGVIVHLMQPAARDFYQLEKLWEERSPALADQR
jgi:ribosome-associated protein